MNISIIGTGYVGLVTGVCFAEMGNNVIFVDIDKKKIEGLKNGKLPFYEHGLEEMVKNNLTEGRFSFTVSLDKAIEKSLVIFIAVGTPADENNNADLKDVFKVAKNIGNKIKDYKIIAIKSTVPVGTCHKVKNIIKEKVGRRGKTFEFDVVSNPEFLKEGGAIDDCMKPERIIVGTEEMSRSGEIMKELYAPFVRTGAPILFMDICSAEMTKYAANAMLATRISFMNEIADICERTGANVHYVRQGIGTDSRIGPKFLFPGIGYGGSCFSKDINALTKMAESVGIKPSILNSIEEVNRRHKLILIEKLSSYFQEKGEAIKDKLIAIWGLSFKPNTDDIRYAPSISMIERLLELGAKINVYDPKAIEAVKKVFGNRLNYHTNSYAALTDAEALLLITEWTIFREPDFKRMKGLMKRPLIFDGRNLYNPKTLKEEGFEYYCIGIRT